MLFLIYINDIGNSLEENVLKLFADDTNLFLFDRDVLKLESKANYCLKKLELWFLANKLSLNIEKTCYTIFTSSKKKNHNISLNLLINNQRIAKVTSCKYLGVIIDDSLKWEEHINYIYKKLIKFTGIFFKVRDVLPKACLSKLYYAFVHPHIMYGIEVYANSSKTALDKLCKLNNKLLRIFLNKKMSSPINTLYETLNTLPIPVLHELQLLLLVHKCTHHSHLMPNIFKNYFVLNKTIHNYNTRKLADLHVCHAKSNFGHRSTMYRGSKFWNNLPAHLKIKSSISVFKKNIKKHLCSRNSNLIWCRL